jgi:hypothetical protein
LSSEEKKRYQHFKEKKAKYEKHLAEKDPSEYARLQAKINICTKCMESIRNKEPLEQTAIDDWKKEHPDVNIFEKEFSLLGQKFSTDLHILTGRLLNFQKQSPCSSEEHSSTLSSALTHFVPPPPPATNPFLLPPTTTSQEANYRDQLPLKTITASAPTQALTDSPISFVPSTTSITSTVTQSIDMFFSKKDSVVETIQSLPSPPTGPLVTVTTPENHKKENNKLLLTSRGR